LETLRNKYPQCFVDGNDPQIIYDAVVEQLRDFPREEDPKAWRCFDNLLRESLGLSLSRDAVEEIFDAFIDYPAAG